MVQPRKQEFNMESQGFPGNSRVPLNHFDAATQADIQHTALSYDSEDEMMGRSRSRYSYGYDNPPLYSKQDIREQYCISERGLGILETQRRNSASGLFGCLAGNGHITSPCAAAARGSLLTVCVRRRVPSDENIHELCRRQPADYAPIPKLPRYPFDAVPAEVYRYDENLDCSYFRRRPRSLCGGPDPSRYTWLPADEDSIRMERPRSIRAEIDHRHSAEHLSTTLYPSVCLAHPYKYQHHHSQSLPISTPAAAAFIVHDQPIVTNRPKHVSFARSQTLTSFDDVMTGDIVPYRDGAGVPKPTTLPSRISHSQERLIDGRKTCDQPPITRQPELNESNLVLMEKLKRTPMKTQATQTEVCLGRKPVPSAQFSLSPRTIQRVKMVSQGAQTNGVIYFNGRKLMKSYSEAGDKFGNYEIDPGAEHEPLQRTQSEEPPRSPFILRSESPQHDLEISRIPETELEMKNELEEIDSASKPEIERQQTLASIQSEETSPVTRSDHESEDSETKSQKEIIIDFKPQIPSYVNKKKPLLKTSSDGDILVNKRRVMKKIEERQLQVKHFMSLSHDNITNEPSQMETRSFSPYFQNSPILHEGVYRDLNDDPKFLSLDKDDEDVPRFRAQDSIDEEFHENIIYGGLFRKQSSISNGELDSLIAESRHIYSIDEDGVVPTLHLLPEEKISPFASTDSLANDLRDHSDGIWNESQATVLQVDSGTENGTGLSASELSSTTLSTLSPGSAMLLTPSSRRKHLLMLQHQQRSSMDTDALDEESHAEQQTMLSPCSSRLPLDVPSTESLSPSTSGGVAGSSTNLSVKSVSHKFLPASPVRNHRSTKLSYSYPLSASVPTLNETDQRYANSTAVVPDLLLARTDSGRTNTDVSESTTTDDYITANSGTDSSRRSGSFKGITNERHHHHNIVQDGSSFESASSIYSVTRDLITEDMVVPSFSPPPILEEASDAAATPVPYATETDIKIASIHRQSPSGSSSSSGSYSLEGGGSCPDLLSTNASTSAKATKFTKAPHVPSKKKITAHMPSVSDDEQSVHYSSSGYYESPIDDESACKQASTEKREWSDEEKRRKKQTFILDIKKHQSTEDHKSPADKSVTPTSTNKDMEVPVQLSPYTEKPKSTKIRNRSPKQTGRRVSHHVVKRSPPEAQAIRTPTHEEWKCTDSENTTDESSSGRSNVQAVIPSKTSPRKIRKIRGDGNRRKSTPRSPTISRSKRRNDSGEEKSSSLPGSLPRRKNKHDSDDSHSNTASAKSNRLSPYRSPNDSPNKRSKITSPESARLKALSAESLRSVSPGSDSVFYSDPSSHTTAPISASTSTLVTTEHQVHCLHCGKEVDIVTTDDPDKSASPSSNGQQADIVQPPACFADSPRLKHNRLYKKLEKRFRSEERAYGERKQHHKYRPEVRAKSEERSREEVPRVKLRPIARSTDASMEYIQTESSSTIICTGNSDKEDESDVYFDPYNSCHWIYIGDVNDSPTWNESSEGHPQETEGDDMDVDKSESIISSTSTESEHEFKKRYQAITHRMVHRKSCLEMYKRQASKSFDSDKTIVVHRESGEFGFRIHGSKPVVVSAIEPDTPAESSGLEVGDIVLSVNGVSVLDKSHSEVVKIAHAGSDTLTLEVARTSSVLSSPLTVDQKSNLLHSGYLWKLAGHVSGTPSDKWKRRWFCLKKDNCLYSYKSDKDSQPVGAIMLVNYAIERCKDDEPEAPARPFRFRLQKPGVQSLNLAADSDVAVSHWCTMLAHAVECNRLVDTWLERTRCNLILPPNAIAKPDCFGYLNKLRTKWKTWTRKYCVLKDACIYFYQDANAKCSSGMICLHGYRVQTMASGKKHAFEVVPFDATQKHFYFHTDSEMDRKRWLAALEFSIDRWLKVG